MTKYRVEYRREGCIGATVCVGYAPEEWELSDGDGLANLKGADKEGEIWVKHLDVDDIEPNKMAAECCPVRVIKVVNEETGEVLVNFENQ